MAKRRKEDALETRERILDAAIEVFHKRGVVRPSLTEIAQLAGVTRGAIYGHFRNKADLFAALTERVQFPDERLCECACDEIMKDPLGVLRSRWLRMFQEVARNREWQLILEIVFHRCELVTESGEIHQRLMEGHAQGVERMRFLITAAVQRGQLPADLAIEVATPLLHGSLVGVLQDWLLQPQIGDLAVLGERYVDALIDMLHASPALRRPMQLQMTC
ncbi:TetR family transcriptional regulator [Microbulbifer thermotolerans]|uniref:TetR family transcriptional regulator n=1 Tax=Microbulbifer thermotolerans TaxID=252514 RepID=A0A143HLI1_MICTH|nr:TetR family transcriptional regulator [Microbulbifer thermotolerans]AMX02574.1 TetR family transcriptional regulator [Microbulbifer thermotolerans]MCX2779716.1 TetR family transcriptional regulator [Microbulbifer thermotolerans]MCX2794941.1 TetR family transcriptional regulator [Microbulbifer thermotolerans]MCX2800505.1 TetR family transcriptional regulator [Microbulbifer thermotolerans]MCX2805113.1 TetR family transcriptional regulator [Microbulbifer thermotolerans]